MVTSFAILNITPDSFSDGSDKMLDPAYALAKAEELIAAGADVLDIGAESTRPGADELKDESELSRLIPFLEKFRNQYPDFPISIDTRKAGVIKEALNYNIQYLNDVSGFLNPKMAEIIGNNLNSTQNPNFKIIAMHSKGGIPAIKSKDVGDDFYGELGLLTDMKKFFYTSLKLAERHGIEPSRFILDPGIGFGKNVKQSLEILDLIPELRNEFNLDILIGASRKSFLRAIINEGIDNRLNITSSMDLDLASQIYHQNAVDNGATFIRTHKLN